MRSPSWGTPAYRRLWASMFSSQLGFWVSITALQWHVAETTDGDEFQVGLLYFIQLSPMLVLTPVVGILLDRCSRARVLKLALAGMALTGFAGAAAVWVDPAGPLLVVQLVAGTLGILLAVNAPTYHALVPSTVPTAQVPLAVSGYVSGQNVARMGGPGVAAGMVSLGLGGTAPGLLLLGGLASVGWIALAGMHPPQRRASSMVSPRPVPVSWRALLRASPALRRSLGLVAAMSAFGLCYVAILPVVALEQLGTGQDGYAALLAIAGAGALGGSLVVARGRLGPESARLLLVLVAIALGVLGLSRGLWVAAPAAFVASAGGLALMVVLNVAIQAESTEETRGRVMSLYVWAWGGLLPVGGLLLGAIASVASACWALLGCGGVLALLALGDWLIHRDQT